MAAINAKMGVRCPDRAIGMQFAHPDEACISKIHLQISVLLNQPPYRGSVRFEVEIHSQNSLAVQSRKRRNRRGQIGKEMQAFSQNAFTGDQWWWQLFEALYRPAMVQVRPIQLGYQRSSVSKPLFHFLERPKDRRRILFTERSPSLLAPRFSTFSNKSRLSSKQLTGDTVSLSRDRFSSACNIKRDKVVFRWFASAFRRAFCAVGTLIESVSVMMAT